MNFCKLQKCDWGFAESCVIEMDISSGEVLLENAIFPGKEDRNIPVAFLKHHLLLKCRNYTQIIELSIIKNELQFSICDTYPKISNNRAASIEVA